MSGPLWLIHGFTGAPASWEAVLANLRRASSRRSFHVLTLPGHGADGGWADEASDFDAVVAAAARQVPEGATGLHLCGYSMGARLALALLLHRPRAFVRATLIGVHPGLASAEERAARRRADGVWEELLLAQGIEAFVSDWEAQPLFASQAAFDPLGLARQRALRRAHRPAGLARALRLLGLGQMPDLRTALSGLTVPIDLVAGDGDPRFVALAGELAALLPDARVQLLPGCGHNPLLEQPAGLARLLARP